MSCVRRPWMFLPGIALVFGGCGDADQSVIVSQPLQSIASANAPLIGRDFRAHHFGAVISNAE
jgi:hypothetical protein